MAGNKSKAKAQAAKNGSSSSGSGLTMALIVVTLAVIVGGCVYLHNNTDYVFDQKVLQTISKRAIAKHGNGSVEALVSDVVSQLREEYGDHILAEPEWMFNNAGGAMGSMLVLHCSFSEYVIIFGTAVGTEGSTGRFLADDYFTILHGEQWAFSAGALEREVYRPGDQHHLKFGTIKQYKMPEDCWALEYARGNIPAMLPFGFADTFFSTLDFGTLWATVRVSAVGMLTELAKGKI
eukprot:TRINITY_DN12478_c4_g7_i1.p2 TRINITY_DN12478_c4_g7~~TRINITY_DN12478_c4_g7_i1.p2  ORF type:complete len:236 (+),score=60.72 TRINITY_DN12478_c4_g7_i1:1839-2546(+)